MKKILTGAGIAAAAAALLVVGIAGAQTTTVPYGNDGNNSDAIGHRVGPKPAEQSPVLQIGPKGETLLRGTIASVSAGVITVNSWGGTWTVNVPSSASVLPASANNDVTQFKAGDFIGIKGTTATSSSWTVTAELVRDWTYDQVAHAQDQANAQAAASLRHEGPRNYVGTASGVSASSFTLTSADGTSYTVNPASNAEIVGRGWATVSFGGIQNGDSVRVYGTNASGTVTAIIIRDMTLGAVAGSSTTVSH